MELAGAGGCGTFAFVRPTAGAVGAGAGRARRTLRPQLKRDSLGNTRDMMNPIQDQVLERLKGLASSWAALAAHATRYAQYCSSIATDDTLEIGHMPWIGPQAYAFRLFPPAKKAWIERFRHRAGRPIPPGYGEFLRTVNGCEAYGLSLYGLPPSLQREPPLLDRLRPQPLDLGTANQDWAHEYEGSGTGFHFGARSWSHDENIGYFWTDEGIRALRPRGELIAEWRDLTALLEDELPLAEQMQVEHTPVDWWH